MNDTLRAFVAEFDPRFAARLDAAQGVSDRLREAVRYSALAPGKRLRPFLAAQCCELVGGDRDQVWPVAFAIECVHAFSLIHDDLPAMDDDDLRRGKPTCHKQFDEATAILAGDALIVHAFAILTESELSDGLIVRLVRELANAAGWQGMIGGQALDLEGEHQPSELGRVHLIHDCKTAAMFRASCRMGAIAGSAQDKLIENLGRFGQALGLAFQIADDLLDVSGTLEAAGKRVGKDAERGKLTYPACVGVERSRQELIRLADEMKALLEPLGHRAESLRQMVDSVASRNY